MGVLPSLWLHMGNEEKSTGGAYLWEGHDATRMGNELKMVILAQTGHTTR